MLASVDESYPLLIAVRQELELAGGDLLAAQGSFDSRLFARGEAAPTGYYDRYTADLGIEQPTRLWGSRLYAGYRVGRGDFPADLGGVKTNDDGELRAGLEIPLLKDGQVDAARTNLRASEIKRRSAEPRIELRRLEIVRQASEAYWNWIAMGLNVDVERHLLRAAEDRRSQLEGRAARGAIPAIQVVDNERLIVDREIRLRGAERDALEAASRSPSSSATRAARCRFRTTSACPETFPPSRSGKTRDSRPTSCARPSATRSCAIYSFAAKACSRPWRSTAMHCCPTCASASRARRTSGGARRASIRAEVFRTTPRTTPS